MNTETDWWIRGYDLGDEDELELLYQQVFEKSMPPEHWRWKLKGLPCRVENVWVAESEQGLIAHYGTLPATIRINGTRHDVLVGVDAMVHPDYRRRGIWTMLVRHAHRVWGEAGIPLVLGLPNEAWGSRAQALGWEPLFPIKYLHFPIRPERVMAEKLSFPLLANLELSGTLWRWWKIGRHSTSRITISEAPGDAFTMLHRLHSQSGQNRITLLHDLDWYRWRYLNNPGKDYRYISAAGPTYGEGVLIIGLESTSRRRTGIIAEIGYQPGTQETARALLQAAISLCLDFGVDTLVGLAIPGSRRFKLFTQMGFTERPRGFLIQAAALRGGLSVDTLREPGRWDLGSSDFDVH